MKTILMFIVYIVSAIAIGAMVAAIIVIPVPLASKILICGLIVMLAGMWVTLERFRTLLVEMHLSQRATFISIEKLRLDPENEDTALNLLLSDIREEKQEKAALDEIGGGVITKLVVYIGFLLVVVLSSWMITNAMLGKPI